MKEGAAALTVLLSLMRQPPLVVRIFVIKSNQIDDEVDESQDTSDQCTQTHHGV